MGSPQGCVKLPQQMKSRREAGFSISGHWIPAFAGMTGLARREQMKSRREAGFSISGHWIPAFAGMTGLARRRRALAVT
jgi:hypothetical protein